MAAKVCLLSQEESFQLETYNVIPDCRRHQHRSKTVADELTRNLDPAQRVARQVRSSDGRRRMLLEAARTWERVTEMTTSAGVALGTVTMQLVSRRAAHTAPARRDQSGRHGKLKILMAEGKLVDALA